MKSTVVFYHSSCPDGFGAAWAAWRKLGNGAQYVPISASQTPDQLEGMRLEGRKIYFLDVCAPAATLKKLAAGNRSVTVIDHHRTNGDRGDLALVDPDAAATGLLIHRVLTALRYDIDPDVAVNLYVAVLTDTGSFHYSSASPEAFEVAGDMIRRGVDPWGVAEQVYETQSAGRLRLLGRVLGSLEIASGGRVASIATTRTDLSEFAEGKDALEGFINYPRSIVGVEVAVSFREEERGGIRVSFRSKGRVDVSAVAARFGGGGHRNAAGCTVPGTLAEVRRKVTEALEAVLP